MKIFLSYQQTGISNKELTSHLGNLRKILNDLGYENFIYYLDDDSLENSQYIVTKVKEKIKKSDIVIAFISHSKKSEGQLLELGIAEILNKKIVFIMDEILKNDYFLIHGLSNKKILYFKQIEEIKNLLTHYFIGK